ncbi:tumor necrosis factor ligand superfamily member 4 [Hipposideros larvatus]
MEGVQPPDENVENTPRRRFQTRKLLLATSIIQGLGLLLCLTYVCLHFHASQESSPHHSSIIAHFTRCDNEKCFIITPPGKEQTMKVQNNSIIINCDGYYLIYLKGYFSQELSLSLHYRKDGQPLLSLSKVTYVNNITVAYLGYKDKVYLNVTTHNTSSNDITVNGGELILILQNPGGFCAY